MPTTPDALVEQYAQRLLSTQDVQRGSLRGDGPPTPLQVAAVLHGMADHTAILHMLNVVAGQQAMARPGDDHEPAATSVGRYLHALGDSIEQRVSRETNAQASTVAASRQAADPES